MATKGNFCLPSKDNAITCGSSSESRYNNLNLNQNNYVTKLTPVCSNSNQTDNTKLFNYEHSNDTNTSNSLRRTKQSFWEKSNEEPNYLNNNSVGSNKFKESKKQLSGSSLSLHIASYENSAQPGTSRTNNDGDKVDTNTNKKFGLKKKQNNFEQKSHAQSPFSTPRQQQHQETVRHEVVDFKQSQTLLNAKSCSSKNKQPPVQSNSSGGCKNDDGDDIDYIYIRKSPGKEYHYYDSQMSKNNDKRMKFCKDITAADNALQRTVAQLYAANSDLNTLKIVWSDQQPPKSGMKQKFRRWRKNAKKQKQHCSGWGHMKGMIVFKDGKGIFITHSVPRYPKLEKNIFDNLRYGQHILCLNIDMTVLEQIILHLFMAHPDIYDINVPEEYLQIDKMKEVSKNTFSKDYDDCQTTEILSTRGGTLKFEITTRTDSVKGKEHLTYPSFWNHLGIFYGTIHVQSWLRSHTLCDRYEHNVKDIMTTETTTAEASRKKWNTGSDHSKLGICKEHDILIVSDMNHAVLEKYRGGFYICLMDSNIYDAHSATFLHKLQKPALPKKGKRKN